MGKIPFKVSARTAKLIGQENFANADGAIIELVKNCYDADATQCMVLFDIPYPSVPNTLSSKEHQYLSSLKGFKTSWYQAKGKSYMLSPKIGEQLKPLQDFFISQSAIYIVDNGTGMSKEIILNQWMEIGTGNKEGKFTSDSGRVKTGAKGIGRFALDRLGTQAEVYTYSRQKNDTSGYYWYMDWQQFNQPNKNLTDITAELTENGTKLFDYIQSSLSKYPKVLGLFKTRAFAGGTLIKISGLKDVWDEKAIADIFKSLEALVPPTESGVEFELQLQHLQSPKEYGQVETAYLDDFDYKIEGKYDANKLKVEYNITRNELDMTTVKSQYSKLFTAAKAPYDLATLLKGYYRQSQTIFELLKTPKDAESKNVFEKVGSFSFIIYFLKIRNTNKEAYPFKIFSFSERDAVMARFGGIKIYRDAFKVRPYGENGNDWLKLGERSAQSPASAGQRIGQWRVGPRQIAGTIHISRITNKQIIDKSDRGSLVENDTFDAFSNIILGIIRAFEYDRSVILHNFFLESKKKEDEEKKKAIKQEAKRMALEIIEKKNKVLPKRTRDYIQKQQNETAQEKKVYEKVLVSGLKKFAEREKDEAEVAQIRGLASLGLIMASFSHELHELMNNTDNINTLERLYQKLTPADKSLVKVFENGLRLIDYLKFDRQKTVHWLQYALTSIKGDKRKRNNLDFANYFSKLSQIWDKALKDRDISLVTKVKASENSTFRAYEVDMDTIFSNLISNSIEAFHRLKTIRERKIIISVQSSEESVTILYEDNGPGLDTIFSKNEEEIFLPLVTSKKDRKGNDIGTGLGMYLLKNTITDYSGQVQIVENESGFKLKIVLPLRKSKNNEA